MKYKAKRIRLSVRMDEGTYMLLRELSERTDSDVSVVVRMLICRGFRGLVGDDGNLLLHRLGK